MAREIIYSAKVEIKGVTPMLMHKCGVIESKNTNATTDYSCEWKETVYLDSATDKVSIPAMNLEAMFRDASKGQKIGKNFMTRIVPTGVVVQEFYIPVYDPAGKEISIKDIEDKKWLFSCAVVIGKNRVNRTRACLPVGWKMGFNINVVNPLLKAEIVKNLIERAGYEVGLCDWRPGAPKPGRFGQFELVKFDVV